MEPVLEDDMADDRAGVLFVCLGNICRSPLAEGIFLDMIEKRGVAGLFDIDSCGTGSWHVGECADSRSIAVARKHGIELGCIGRQVDPPSDFERFDWLIAMDRSNMRNLLKAGAPEGKVRLMRSFDPAMEQQRDHELDVPDPYDWPGDGFESVYQMLDSACAGLLEFLLAQREE
jgi:protein-tyrosine phosphatase